MTRPAPRAERVAFVGSKELGLLVLAEMYRLAPASLACLITLDDTADGRSVLGDYSAFAEKTGLPLRILRRGSELEAAIREIAPDLCMVAGWYTVLPDRLLAAVPGGFVGVHASLLPEYRGGAPLVWAMIHGERKTGVTLFHFDSGMDTGDIVGQEAFEIADEDTIADVLRTAGATSVRLVRDHYPGLVSGKAPRVPQNHARATYGAMRSPADGRLAWQETAAQLRDFVRAQTHPYPGAFCQTQDGRRLTIWSAAVFPHAYAGPPGKVVAL
jgi:methionyl-tRNA formyltransferase